MTKRQKKEKEEKRKCQKQNDRKTKRPCCEARLVKTNDFINGDLKMNCNTPTNFKYI